MILDFTGAGGMGQVFKAQHRRMKRIVALKLLTAAAVKNASNVMRFQREVEAAAKLTHSNIVTAYDAGVANGKNYLVMEYVEGSDLSAHVKKNGPIPVAKAVDYILQAARGLEFAHGEGVIHRDIKPANLLLDRKGIVKILDMGLARLDLLECDVATRADLTGTGTVMGTIDYMAPEQARSPRHADARADIYSLGCSLYFLITGKATYDGESLTAKIVAHQIDPIPSLRDVKCEVPPQLDTVFKKMVAKKVEDRYQSITEVVADLEKCRDGLQSASVRDATAMRRSSQTQIGLATGQGPSQMNARWLIGTGAAGLLLVFLGIVVAVRNKDGKEVARIEVLDGNSFEVQSTSPHATATPHSADPVTLPTTANVAPEPDSSLAAPSISATDPAPPIANAPFDAKQARAHQDAWAKHLGSTAEKTNSIGMRMTLVPPGDFLMGSSDKQVEAALKAAAEIEVDGPTKDHIQTAERPQHQVIITRPFWMGTTEVTVAHFRKFAEATAFVTEAEQYGFGNSFKTVADENTTAADKQQHWHAPGFRVTCERCPNSAALGG